MSNEAARRPRRRSYLFLACLIAASPRAALARGLDGAEAEGAITLAEQKAAQAFEAYQSKRYAEAVGLYIEAYEASPNADILYNVARIYDTKLGDRPLAINFYRRYIADPGAVADRIPLANERLVALREAELVAARPAAQPAASAATAVAAPAPLAAPRGWSAGEVTGVAMVVAGVVGVGVGAGFGLAAMDGARTSRELCDGSVCREQRGIDAAKRATDQALVSTIGFASGGALLALGSACYFWLGGEPSEVPVQAASRGFDLGAHIAQNSSGWSLEVAGSW